MLFHFALGITISVIALYVIYAAISEIPIFKLHSPGHCGFCGARMPPMPMPPKTMLEHTHWAIEHHGASCVMHSTLQRMLLEPSIVLSEEQRKEWAERDRVAERVHRESLPLWKKIKGRVFL